MNKNILEKQKYKKRKNIKHISKKESKNIKKYAKFFVIIIIIFTLWNIIFLSGVYLKRFFMTNSFFLVKEENVEFNGNSYLRDKDLKYLLGIETFSKNIFKIETNNWLSKLLEHPWIEDADIDKIYPNEIRINIVEHEPAIYVVTDKGTLKILSFDKKMLPINIYRDNLDLTIVTGLFSDTNQIVLKNKKEQLIEFVNKLNSVYKDINFKIMELNVTTFSKIEVNVKFKNKYLKLLLNGKNDNVNLKNVDLLLSELYKDNKLSNINYIDATVPNKIYIGTSDKELL